MGLATMAAAKVGFGCSVPSPEASLEIRRRGLGTVLFALAEYAEYARRMGKGEGGRGRLAYSYGHGAGGLVIVAIDFLLDGVGYCQGLHVGSPQATVCGTREG